MYSLTNTDPSTLDRLERLVDDAPPNIVRPLTGMQYEDQIKYVSWDFNNLGFDSVELLHITDVQFGHKLCKLNRLTEYRDWILAKPNRFMLWGGDMVDAVTVLSKGSPWENISEPESQVYQLLEFWKPARHRILGSVGGNHERRSIPTFGDLGRLIASFLRIPYSDGKQLIDIHFGQHKPFKVQLWHGVGGAATQGAIAQVLDRMMKRGDAQLYLFGHLHQPMVIPSWREVRDPETRSVKPVKICGVISSSFLDVWGTYGEIKGFNISDVMMGRCVLEPNGHWEVTLR